MVTWNVKPILRLIRFPVTRTVFRQWAEVYRSFIRERFVKYSRGGGDWAPLKRKRKRGKREKAAILRDTGTLFAALNPKFRADPGAMQLDLDSGIRVGFGGGGQHPKASMTVAELASIHHFGRGRMPKREILVRPDFATMKKMANLVERHWDKIGRGN